MSEYDGEVISGVTEGVMTVTAAVQGQTSSFFSPEDGCAVLLEDTVGMLNREKKRHEKSNWKEAII